MKPAPLGGRFFIGGGLFKAVSRNGKLPGIALVGRSGIQGFAGVVGHGAAGH